MTKSDNKSRFQRDGQDPSPAYHNLRTWPPNQLLHKRRESRHLLDLDKSLGKTSFPTTSRCRGDWRFQSSEICPAFTEQDGLLPVALQKYSRNPRHPRTIFKLRNAARDACGTPSASA